MQAILRALLLGAPAVALLTADVTYQQSTKFKGGSLIETVHKMASNPILGRMGGGGMKQAFEDQNFTVYIKGNKMARVGPHSSMIYDLDAGSITTVNHDRQTYTTQTFDELRERMQQMQQRMNRGQGGGQGDIQFDVKIDKTSNVRQIDGETAKETIVTLTAKQASEQGQMVVTVHAWLVPMNDARREVQAFNARLSEKYSAALTGFSPMMGAANSGLSAAMREMHRLDAGFPVLSESVITGVSGAGGPMAAMAAMGGGDAKSDSNTPLIDTETASHDFAEGGVDDSKFAIPAGYKEEQPRRR